jgi:hypothetical protein
MHITIYSNCCGKGKGLYFQLQKVIHQHNLNISTQFVTNSRELKPILTPEEIKELPRKPIIIVDGIRRELREIPDWQSFLGIVEDTKLKKPITKKRI